MSSFRFNIYFFIIVKMKTQLLILFLHLFLFSNSIAKIDDELYRKLQIVNSMRCMTDNRRKPNSNYILYNEDHGILSMDFIVSWHPQNLYTLSSSSLSTTNRLRFFRSRVYLDNSMPLFYANIDKRNQC